MNTDALAEGAKLRARREALYVSRSELASLADVSLPSVRNFEAGLLPRSQSRVFCRVLGVLDELERRQGGPLGGARPDPRTAV